MAAKWILLLPCLALMICRCSAVCGIIGPIWRNNNQTCPRRSVCGDVFEMVRDWRNGTSCQEQRTLSNCLCPGNTVCPFDNPAHTLYASSAHKQIMCDPVCQLPWCGNVRSAPDGRSRQDQIRVSMTAEQRAQEFGNKTYYRMECRCARHIAPASHRRRTVISRGYRYNAANRRYYSIYVCDARWTYAMPSMSDPCRRQPQ